MHLAVRLRREWINLDDRCCFFVLRPLRLVRRGVRVGSCGTLCQDEVGRLLILDIAEVFIAL